MASGCHCSLRVTLDVLPIIQGRIYIMYTLYTMYTAQHAKRWSVTKLMYKSLVYMNNDPCGMSPWWHNTHTCPNRAQKSRLIIQLVLNKDWYQHGICQCCNSYVEMSIQHILFQCASLREHRLSLWSNRCFHII